MFWKKRKSRQIKDKLKLIHKKVSLLKLIPTKKAKALEMVNFIIDNIDEVKEILELEANEQKSKPWIDAKYDKVIDKMLDDEKKALDDLKKELKQYVTDFNTAIQDDEIAMLTEELNDKSKSLEARNQTIVEKIKGFAKSTLKKRLARSSITCPAINTSDGVSWRNIATVARELGGWLEPAGRHAAVIKFPNSVRSIPVSGDVHSGVIARQFVVEITHLPLHKRPKSTNLSVAFSVGDIHRAA
jgi:hypothetical protein